MKHLLVVNKIVIKLKKGVDVEQISKEDIVQAIDRFLLERYELKAKDLNKSLEKAQLSGDQQKLLEVKTDLNKLQVAYVRETWIEYAARTMAKQLKFGTHLSKGIHPDSVGNNVYFNQSATVPEIIVGTHNLAFVEPDANGNAAALPLASFLNLEIKSGSRIKLRDLIIEQSPVLQGCFADNLALSNEYEELFRGALLGSAQMITFERNKQILWPNNENAIEEDSYTCCIPLYPSAFAHDVYQKINDARYSDENKAARDNRYKKTAENLPYISINKLAVLKLGGSNSQNIGLLVKRQEGRVFLLPAMPPILSTNNEFNLAKVATTIFNKRLRYYCRRAWNELVEVIDSAHNQMQIRDQRRIALEHITQEILTIAISIQTHWSPGWSKGYELNMHEKYWLDPRRADLEGEEQFKNDSANADLENIISFHFARWLNEWLREKYPNLADDFDDAEIREWQREMASTFRSNQSSR